jgi:hypothetical protein
MTTTVKRSREEGDAEAPQIFRTTILYVEEAIRAAHHTRHTEVDHAYVLYGDGCITHQAGGAFMWSRRETTHMAPIANRNVISKMPMLSSTTKCYAYVTEEDALRLRRMMKRLYGLSGAEEPNDFERMLGCTVEQKKAGFKPSPSP